MLNEVLFEDTTKAINSLEKSKGRGVYVDRRLFAKKEKNEKPINLDRWIIFPKGRGRCIVVVGEKEDIFNLSLEHAIAILVPAGSGYSLEAVTENITVTIFLPN